jgi:hypothetical protein
MSIPVKRAMGPWGAFRIVTTVERDERNRWLVITIDGERYRRSSTEQLDGVDAPRIRAVIYENIPAGNYDVSARLVRNDKKEFLANDTVCVMGMDVECGEPR